MRPPPIVTNPNEITAAPAVDFELNVQIQIASGSCNLYTRRDLIISNSPFTFTNTIKAQNVGSQSQQSNSSATAQSGMTTGTTSSGTTATINVGTVININKIEYQVSQFSLPGVDVDAHYSSKHNSTINSALNKRASFYCRAMIQSPTTQITIHPLLLDFLEQTLEHVSLPHELPQDQVQTVEHSETDSDHLNTM